MPEYFRDDWLNEYHDMCRAPRSATADAGSGGGRVGIVATGVISSPSSSDHDDGELPSAPGVATSRLADSDYRFVYLGPRVSAAICALLCSVTQGQRA